MSSLEDTVNGNNLEGLTCNFTTDVMCNFNSAIHINAGFLRNLEMSIPMSFSFQVWFKLSSYVKWSCLLYYTFDSSFNSLIFNNGWDLTILSNSSNIFPLYQLVFQTSKWYQLTYVYNNGQNILYLNGILIASQFSFIHRNINGSFYIGRYGNITLSQAKLFDAAISQQMALNDYVTSFDGKF